MYRGGKICLDAHFRPLWARNVPHFGVAHAMALGVRAEAEVIIHTLRQWWERNQDNRRYVLLKKDFHNAFNEAEPAAFLPTVGRRLPGCARYAHWCYGRAVNLIYGGEVFKESSRGQQGCPAMMPTSVQ